MSPLGWKLIAGPAVALALNLMGAPAHAAGGTGTWVGDIDCDGRPDVVAYAVTAEAVRLDVTFHARSRISTSLAFPIGTASQASLCAAPVSVALESLDFDPVAAGAGRLPGFRRSTTCKGIALDDGLCDVVHVYWNHEAQGLSWWRR